MLSTHSAFLSKQLWDNNELESDKIPARLLALQLRFKGAAFTVRNSANICSRVEILAYCYFRKEDAYIDRNASLDMLFL